MTIKQKFSSIDQSKLTADQKAFLTKIKSVTKNFTDAEMNKKVEAPLNGFIEKAKEKMPEAIKSAPAKSTSKAKPSQTSKPKRTVMSVAKEIRKQGESWKDAQARASKMMKEDSKDLSKTVETELEKLSKLVRSQKSRAKLSGLSGTNIKRDAVRRAKPKGRRISKEGNVYYENRDNRTDRLAPNYPKNSPLLENGAYLTDPNFGNFQNQVLEGGGLFQSNRPKSALIRDRKNVNHSEDYEVRYSKPRPSRTGYKGIRKFALGGTVVTDLAGHTAGGDGGLNAGMPLNGFTNIADTGLVGETGAMSSGEMFMAGGFMSGGEGYAGQSVLLTNTKTPIRQRFIRTELVLQDKQPNGSWSAIVRKTGEKVPFDVYAEDFEQYAKGGALTNERLHVNHDEDYEVRYSKSRPSRKGYKGARKFMAGGSMDTPKIYVADLEAYNNGKLVGEYLDLTDYNDADELMDAIQDVLKKSGGEEYAIHDYENFPSSMYSEYMGKKDFEELYNLIDLAKQKDLPLEVVAEVVSQFDESAVDEYQGKYDSAEDFAQELVDELGIQSFNDFQYYLSISETDKRLLSQEMADSYTDDIRDEDGGNRIIEEAGLNVDEYEDASDDSKEELLDLAVSMVNDKYYDKFYEGLDDPYYFLVEEQGLYDAESFTNAGFVRVDYYKLADVLDQDYTMISYNGDVYVFNIR